jgi:hypothetical protein
MSTFSVPAAATAATPFNPVNTYWCGTGKYPQHQALSDALMPFMGKAATVEGELIRASSKIYWDLYNNGFGNNWSGAWNYLNEWNTNTAMRDDVKKALVELSEYRCGGLVVGGAYDNLKAAVECLADAVVEYVLANAGAYTPNDTDMLALSEDDYYPEEEGEEDYGRW